MEKPVNHTEELENCYSELGIVKKEYEDFVYIVSHDLKAPLRAILNLSSWVEEDLAESENEDIKNNIKLLKSRVVRLEQMMQALLEFSRIGRINIERNSLDVSKILEEIHLVNSQKINPFELIKPNTLPIFRTYSEKLYQVFQILVENAVKFNDKQNKKVEIDVKEKEEFYQFSVTDNGIGIQERDIDKIFTIFYTVQPKDKTPDIGAGLSLAKKIVEFAGGKISVQSIPDEKTTFTFTWKKNPDSIIN